MRWLLPALVLTIAAAPAAQLTFAGQAFPKAEIVDARAIADATGAPVVLVTLTPRSAKRLAILSAARIGKPVPIAVGGKTVMTPIFRAPITTGTLEISGAVSFDAAAALARRISGKPPLPDSLDE